MLKGKVYDQRWLISLALLTGVAVFSRCMDHTQRGTLQEPKTVTAYAGSAACKDCHRQAYEAHLQHFHHLTSAPAADSSILGSFHDSANRFYYHPGLYISLEKRDDRFFQVAWQNGKEQLARPFDLVIGSGKRGQTYLYWHNQNLFQLPISYFTATREWTNSPGYSNKVQFNRPITARCMECHSTWIQQEEQPDARADVFSRQGMILGVECEKCHGPALEHSQYHRLHPEEKKAHGMASFASFSRVQQLDMCRLCHGGRLTKTRPSFSYRPGDRLADFFSLDTTLTPVEEMDVHGNQYGMLASSKCFQGSSMTCNSCHHPHQNESGQPQLFAAKCMACHATGHEKLCRLSASEPEALIQSQCINCHMPEQASKSIMVLQQGATVPISAYMRSHHIGIYKDISLQILQSSKANQKKK